MRKKKRRNKWERFLRRNKEGRKTFWGLVPEGSSHGCSITERASRAEVVRGLKNTFLMVKKRAPSAARHLLRVAYLWGPLYCMWFFFCSFFPFSSSSSFPSLHVCGWNGNFSHSSPFLTIVLMLEDQTEKNIIRPASRNRPRLHLLGLVFCL
jgi:hypothetical protein